MALTMCIAGSAVAQAEPAPPDTAPPSAITTSTPEDATPPASEAPLTPSAPETPATQPLAPATQPSAPEAPTPAPPDASTQTPADEGSEAPDEAPPETPAEPEEAPSAPPASPRPVVTVGQASSASGNVKMDAMGDLDLDLVALMGTDIKVVTATKTAQSLEDAPAIIEVITADDIQRWGYRSVAEALNHIAGFYVIDDGILPNLSVRGVSGGLMSESSMVKVMIDGQPVSFRSTAGNWLGPELIPLSAISRVEIIRGPASALYGADAFLGVINVITKTGQEVGGLQGSFAGKMLNSQLGNGNFVKNNLGMDYDAVGGDKYGGVDVLVGFGGAYQNRYGLELPSTSPTPRVPSYNIDKTRSEGAIHRGDTFYTKLRYTTPNGKFHLFGSYSSSWIRRGGDFSHWGQLTHGMDDHGRHNETLISLRQQRADLGVEIAAHEQVTVRIRAGYFDGGPRIDDRIEVTSDFFYVKRAFGYRGFTAGTDVVWTPISKLQLVAGGELVFDRERLPTMSRIDKTTGDVIEEGEAGGNRRSSANLVNPGAYLQLNWLAWDPYARLTAGLRYDHHNIYGSKVAGRGGIVSHWGKRRKVTTKLLYGSAFKAPSPQLLFAVPLRPGDIIGNRNLDPMTIHTFESQLAWAPLREVRLSTGVTYSMLFDKAEFRPQGINITAQNVASQRGVSWETRGDFSHKKWFKSYVSFDLQHGVRNLNEEGYIADLLGTANVVHPFWITRAGVDFNIDKARIALMTQAMVVGKRRSSDANTVENGGAYQLGEYALINAGIRTHDFKLVGRGFTRFSIHGYNLTNTRTPEPGHAGYDYPRLPLELMFKVTHFHR